MFGYVRAHKSELLVREYEQYKAVYCQLCKELGDSFGVGARYILSYDVTFYVMLALSQTGSELKLREGRCTVNPAKKCKFIETGGDEYIKGAAFSIISTYHKLKDNIEDESFFKSLGSRLGLLLFKRKYKKAAKKYPWMAEIVETAMKNQAQAEKSELYSIDSCSEPTATMLSKMCEELARDEMQAAVLKEFGYYLGRWIYIIDAADDLKDDLADGSFNPFVKMLGLEEYHNTEHLKGEKKAALVKEFTDEDRDFAHEKANEVLNATMSMMLPAVNLMELEGFGSIIENIVTKGLPEMQREMLFLHVKDKSKKKTPANATEK